METREALGLALLGLVVNQDQAPLVPAPVFERVVIGRDRPVSGLRSLGRARSSIGRNPPDFVERHPPLRRKGGEILLDGFGSHTKGGTILGGISV